jgi:hypothetical protein
MPALSIRIAKLGIDPETVVFYAVGSELLML